LKVETIDIDQLKEYGNNAKEHPPEQIEQIKKSILDFGNNDPIAIDELNVIIEGHGRYRALLDLGYKTAEIIRLSHLTDEQKKAYRLIHNKMTMNSDFDLDKLEQELAELTAFDVDMTAFGFDESLFDIDEPTEGEELDEHRETLQERFIVPPFSILDTKQGYWQDRKDIWKRIIHSDEGREQGLLGQGLKELAEKTGADLTGTSIFDPVLCEVLLNWFCPAGGKVIDPFAGGSVRGLVSVLLGNEYTGVDLSAEQIKANIKNYKAIEGRQDLTGADLNKPNWINGDSSTIDELVTDDGFDFLLTCPPYADLEVYSDDPRDISNMPYEQFLEVYREIIRKATAKLKDNAYAAIVVGEVRDKHGYYYNFVGDTVEAFRAAGLEFYNECILLNQIATGAMRAGRQFSAFRKVVKTHQNVLVFVKGSEKQIDLEKYNYNVA